MKKILIPLIILLAACTHKGLYQINDRAIQVVDTGLTADDGTGDPIRTAMQKINANFVYHASILDTLVGDNMLTNAVSAVAVNDSTAAGWGLSESANTLRVDTASGKVATAYDISGFISSETLWIADSSNVLHWSDTTTKVATAYDISGFLSTESDPVWTVAEPSYLAWTDTTSKIASQYDISTLLDGETDPVWVAAEPSYLTWSDTTAIIRTAYDLTTGLALKADQTAIDTLTGDNELTNKLALKADQTAVDTLTGDNELTNKLALKANQTAIDTLTGDNELTNKLALKADQTAIDTLTGDNELTNKLALKADLISPVFTTPNIGSATGSISGNAGTVTGFTPASGSLTLDGADAITVRTTGATDVTWPTTGTLATTANINDSISNMKSGIFNVLDYGVVMDTSINSTVAFQSCIDAAKNGTIIIPAGSFRIDTVCITANPTIRGVGWEYNENASVIYSRADFPIIHINHNLGEWNYGATIENLHIQGDTSLGNQHGILIDGQSENILNRLQITDVGGHGIYSDSSTHVVYTKIIYCRIENNAKDGIHMVGAFNSQLNAIRIKDNHIIGNGVNGITISGTNIDIWGNTIEGNGNIGIFVSARSLGAVNMNISNISIRGNYFEQNVAGNIIAESWYSSPNYQYVIALSIQENYFYLTNAVSTADANILIRAASGSTYHTMFSNMKIADNHYEGDLDHLNGDDGSAAFSPSAQYDIEGTDLTKYGALDECSIIDWGTNSSPMYLSVTAAGGINTLYPVIRCSPSGGAVDITADPQVIDGIDGMTIILIGSDDTETLTIDDGAGVQTAGGASRVLGAGDMLILKYLGAWTDWFEMGYINN